MAKLCFDATECEKLKVPVDTALYIASLYLGKLITPDTFQNVCYRGLIEFDGFDLKRQPINARLTQSGVDLIESIFLNSEFRTPECAEDRYDKLAKKMQELFPEGKKPGTKLMWRDSQAMIAKKLKALVKKYGVKFTDEEALDATKKYVNSFNGDYQFMQVLKYFISKRNQLTGEETSQFLSYIENAGQEDVNNDSWRDSVR
jgi:hypothetical protein